MSNLQFAQFLCEKLDGERGRQTQLANDLQISKSTITAWRNGAKPDFISCLMLSEHFGLDPVRMLEMVGDETYLAIYRRFLAGRRDNRIWRPPNERDLYPEAVHAEIHRELQLLLESNTEEALAIVTMIRAACSQVAPEGANRHTRRESEGRRTENDTVAGKVRKPD